MKNCRLRRLRNQVRWPEGKPIIQFRVYCPKESKCHALARFVLFVRLVFEKLIRVWIILSWPRDLSKTHWPKGSNLPNQTNHLICRHNQKKNPSKILLVLLRYNENQNLNQKTDPCKRLRVHRCNPWAFFDFSYVAAGSQSARLQIEFIVKIISFAWPRFRTNRLLSPACLSFLHTYYYTDHVALRRLG